MDYLFMINRFVYSSFRSGSISNLSSSLSEHLHNLVRAFSSRTERVKLSTAVPPTPSTSPEYDGNSDALSGTFHYVIVCYYMTVI